MTRFTKNEFRTLKAQYDSESIEQLEARKAAGSTKIHTAEQTLAYPWLASQEQRASAQRVLASMRLLDQTIAAKRAALEEATR